MDETVNTAIVFWEFDVLLLIDDKKTDVGFDDGYRLI